MRFTFRVQGEEHAGFTNDQRLPQAAELQDGLLVPLRFDRPGVVIILGSLQTIRRAPKFRTKFAQSFPIHQPVYVTRRISGMLHPKTITTQSPISASRAANPK